MLALIRAAFDESVHADTAYAREIRGADSAGECIGRALEDADILLIRTDFGILQIDDVRIVGVVIGEVQPALNPIWAEVVIGNELTVIVFGVHCPGHRQSLLVEHAGNAAVRDPGFGQGGKRQCCQESNNDNYYKQLDQGEGRI